MIRSKHQLKEEQSIFLLEEIGKKLEEYKKAIIALRYNQMAEAKKKKKKLQVAKKS